MFMILLRFSTNKADAPRLMEAHNTWLREGFEAGVFHLAGSLPPGLGGAILAHGATRPEIEARLQADPFVAADVVRPEIVEITPARTDPRLAHLAA